MIQQAITGSLADILPSHKEYRSYQLRKKSGGYRWIDAPSPQLKKAQKELLETLYLIKPHPAAVGFCPGLAVPEGAYRHLGAQVILNIDLADFFGSCKKRHLYLIKDQITEAFLKRFGEKMDEDSFTQFLDLVTHYGHLPQGAPTSPYLANLVFKQVDQEIEQMAGEMGFLYSRYADDITFSTKDKSRDIAELLKPVNSLLNRWGFTVNRKKTRIARKHRRMDITGVVINDSPAIPRDKRRAFEAKVHNIWVKKQPITKLELKQINGFYQWLKLPKQKISSLKPLPKPAWLVRISQKIGQLNSPSWPIL